MYHLYGFNYVLSNDGMTVALQGQGHSIQITEMEEMTYFGEITGAHSLSIPHCSGRQILAGIFQKLNIQYFTESYGGLVKSVA